MTWLALHRRLDAALEQLESPLPEWTDMGGHWEHWAARFGPEDDAASAALGRAIESLAAGRPLPLLTRPQRLLLYCRLRYASDWIEGLLSLPAECLPLLPPQPLRWLLIELWSQAGWPTNYALVESLLRALHAGNGPHSGRN